MNCVCVVKIYKHTMYNLTLAVVKSIRENKWLYYSNENLIWINIENNKNIWIVKIIYLLIV